MKELLPKQSQDYMERARHVANKAVRPVAAELDRTGEYPWSVIEALREADLMGIWIPEEYGGKGAGVLDLCIVVEELSKACGGVGVSYAVNALGSFPIIVGGTEEQKQQVAAAGRQRREADRLRALREGVGLGRRQLAHRAPSATATSTSSTATRSGTPTATRRASTPSTPRRGPIAAIAASPPIMVEKGTPGFEIGKREDADGYSLRAGARAALPELPRAGREPARRARAAGFGNAMKTLDRARPGVAAQAVGLAQGALDWAMRYTSERQQFGQSVLSFQATQFKVADLATEIEAARQMVWTAARAIDAGARQHHQVRRHGQGLRDGRRDEGHDRGRPDVRRLRLLHATTRSRSTCATPRSPRSTRARTRSSDW